MAVDGRGSLDPASDSLPEVERRRGGGLRGSGLLAVDVEEADTEPHSTLTPILAQLVEFVERKERVAQDRLPVP